jgi:GTP-binding protein HflX
MTRKKKLIETAPDTLLMGVIHPDIVDEPQTLPADQALLEAVDLTEALSGIEVRYSHVFTVKNVKPNTLIGGGQVEEIKSVVEAEGLSAVVIDHSLTPSQQRNLEVALECKVLDRTAVILEIFAERARSRAGQVQVALARLKYQQSRLVRAWSHLERQRGGMSKTGGPGERQLELDKRMLADQIGRLEKQLEKIQRDRRLNRQRRSDHSMPTVALVGYTNAGKSTLFRLLTEEEDTYVADQLFATLDPLSRQMKLPTGQNIVLTDTVGFVRDLPHQLVAAFAATLEEVVDADLILLVQDLSNPQKKAQFTAVQEVLKQIEASDVPMLQVWNKADCVDEDKWPAEGVTVSAVSELNIDALKEQIVEELHKQKPVHDLKLPHSAGRQIAWLQSKGAIVGMLSTEEGWQIQARLNDAELAHLHRLA